MKVYWGRCRPPVMVGFGRRPWRWLVRWRAASFLVGGTAFVVAMALAAFRIATGEAGPTGLLEQTFTAAGWMAASVGLLGFYPGLARRRRWLARAGALLAAAAVVSFATVGATSLLYLAGVPDGDFVDVVPFLLPVVLFGVLLPFPTVAVACLRSVDHPRAVGVLLFAPTAFFVADYLTLDPPLLVLVFACATAIAHFAIGRVLLSGRVPRHAGHVGGRKEPTPGGRDPT